MGYKTALILGLLPQLISASIVCDMSAAASKGDTCASFVENWGTTLEEFQELNPGVSCPNLTEGQKYCVIGTVTGGPAPTSSTTTTLKTTTKATTTTSSTKYEPTQPGVPANCDKFHLVASGDGCDTIAAKYGITDAQFKAWNPQIDAGCTNLWLNYYVCVHIPGSTTTTSVPDPTPTPPAPQPQMPGIVDNCKKFHKVVEGDNCYTINTAAGITLAQFRSWNTLIDAGCTNLWMNYYVCIGV